MVDVEINLEPIQEYLGQTKRRKTKSKERIRRCVNCAGISDLVPDFRLASGNATLMSV